MVRQIVIWRLLYLRYLQVLIHCLLAFRDNTTETSHIFLHWKVSCFFLLSTWMKYQTINLYVLYFQITFLSVQLLRLCKVFFQFFIHFIVSSVLSPLGIPVYVGSISTCTLLTPLFNKHLLIIYHVPDAVNTMMMKTWPVAYQSCSLIRGRQLLKK